MKVSGLSHFSLGQAVPKRDHAVCVSLPTIKDLIGYEEKNPKTLAAMRSGYPRFVRNHRIKELDHHYKQIDGKDGNESFFFSNHYDWELFRKLYPITDWSKDDCDGLIRVCIPKDSKSAQLCRLFQQHSGTGISSRLAEDILYRKGIISKREFIRTSKSSSTEEICKVISKAHGPEIDSEDVLLANSGANAFYSLFQAAIENARTQKKKIWIRLGWLYLDTIETIELLVKEDEKIVSFYRLQDFNKLKALFADFGHLIAGVITEFPTNPLMQSFDLENLQALCRKHQALLVVDPTMVSPKNAKVSKFADIVVNSLTKYANWEGDVMMGSLVFPKQSRLGRSLMQRTQDLISRPFSRDLDRLAEQIPFYESFIEHTNASTIKVAEFLMGHPEVKEVRWAYQSRCSENYQRLAGDAKPGCVISFEIKGDFETFYNSLGMLKSPSFGTEFSLCCPYVYLAHYSMMHNEDGKKQLKEAGISPQLLRLSVGLEPSDQIISVLRESLDLVHSNS